MTPEAEAIESLTADIGIGYCVDIGAREIQTSNVAGLIVDRGWSALLIEARPERVKYLRENFADYPVEVRKIWVNTRNVNGLVRHPPDVLNIDIDGQDYHIWSALRATARVVCIEYNPSRPDDYIMPLTEGYDWKADEDRTRFGAGRGAMTALAESKGYRLYADTGHNLIFALH